MRVLAVAVAAVLVGCSPSSESAPRREAPAASLRDRIRSQLRLGMCQSEAIAIVEPHAAEGPFPGIGGTSAPLDWRLRDGSDFRLRFNITEYVGDPSEIVDGWDVDFP